MEKFILDSNMAFLDNPYVILLQLLYFSFCTLVIVLCLVFYSFSELQGIITSIERISLQAVLALPFEGRPS